MVRIISLLLWSAALGSNPVFRRLANFQLWFRKFHLALVRSKSRGRTNQLGTLVSEFVELLLVDFGVLGELG